MNIKSSFVDDIPRYHIENFLVRTNQNMKDAVNLFLKMMQETNNELKEVYLIAYKENVEELYLFKDIISASFKNIYLGAEECTMDEAWEKKMTQIKSTWKKLSEEDKAIGVNILASFTNGESV